MIIVEKKEEEKEKEEKSLQKEVQKAEKINTKSSFIQNSFLKDSLYSIYKQFSNYTFYQKMMKIIKEEKYTMIKIGISFYMVSFFILFFSGFIHNLQFINIIIRSLFFSIFFFLLGDLLYLNMRILLPELFEKVEQEYYEFDLLIDDNINYNFEDNNQKDNQNKKKELKKALMKNDNKFGLEGESKFQSKNGEDEDDIKLKNKYGDPRILAQAIRSFLKKD